MIVIIALVVFSAIINFILFLALYKAYKRAKAYDMEIDMLKALLNREVHDVDTPHG